MDQTLVAVALGAITAVATVAVAWIQMRSGARMADKEEKGHKVNGELDLLLINRRFRDTELELKALRALVIMASERLDQIEGRLGGSA